MDWSLVLASQDVPTTILNNEGSWSLAVQPGDYERAMEAIRLYRLENRGWKWQQHLPWPGAEFHFGSILFCFVLALAHALSDRSNIAELGMMNSALVSGGQWWRFFTAIFLHADIAHLASNVVFGIIALGLAMARFGAGAGLLGALLAGAAGNVAGYFIYEETHRGLGASGMMMGAMGLVTLHYLGYWREHPHTTRLALKGAVAGAGMFVLFGVDPNSDVLAHFGGFVTGALIGGALSLVSRKEPMPRWIDSLAFILFCAISVAAWVFALGAAGRG